ncbi:MAG: hypothetical protein C5B49_09230 [Bdellovibrio sp.]|nr:MAG: hypothetical protein C5B49_09230 [Bdellovibrio sp.]
MKLFAFWCFFWGNSEDLSNLIDFAKKIVGSLILACRALIQSDQVRRLALGRILGLTGCLLSAMRIIPNSSADVNTL